MTLDDRNDTVRRRRALTAALLGACLTALLIAILPGCGRGPAVKARPLAVIGLDAADWALIDSLSAAGRLPHLTAFLDEATAGTNMSLTPLRKSPLLWATMATGLRPEMHGIGGFTRDGGRDGARGGGRTDRGEGDHDGRLLKASDWRAPAIWDLLGAVGRRSCVIGWWVTYPARDIDGTMVADADTYTPRGWRDAAGLVRPDSLREVLEPLEVGDDDPAVERALDEMIDRGAVAGHEDDLAVLIDDLRATIAGDLSYVAMARELASRGATDDDLFAVYLRGIDLVGHRFWPFYQTDKSPVEMDPVKLAAFSHVVPRYYEFTDRLVGELLDVLPPDRAVVLVSDHGFHGPRHRRMGWVLGVKEHRPQGIFAVRSPLYAKGLRFDRMGILDVGPTLLALLGLPASEEMPGTVLQAGLTSVGRRQAEALEKMKVSSYQGLAPVVTDTLEGGEPELDEAVKQQLKSLGYIH